MSERTIHRCARLALQGFTKKGRDLRSACRATLEVSSRKVRIRAAWRARKTHIHRTLAEQPRATRVPQGAGPAPEASLVRSACPERVSTRRTTLARAVRWVILQMCLKKQSATRALRVAEAHRQDQPSVHYVPKGVHRRAVRARIAHRGISLTKRRNNRANRVSKGLPRAIPGPLSAWYAHRASIKARRRRTLVRIARTARLPTRRVPLLVKNALAGGIRRKMAP